MHPVKATLSEDVHLLARAARSCHRVEVVTGFGRRGRHFDDEKIARGSPTQHLLGARRRRQVVGDHD